MICFIMIAIGNRSMKQLRRIPRLQRKESSAMRLFAAVLLSEEMKKSLITAMHSAKKLGLDGRYVPAQELHMTLAFIGEVPDAGPVKTALGTVQAEKFRLVLSDYMYFSDVLTVGVKSNQKLKKCAQEIRTALKNASLPFDPKPFTPHISVVRGVKGKRPVLPPAPAGEMTVSAISLMRSDTTGGKTTYKEIMRLPL